MQRWRVSQGQERLLVSFIANLITSLSSLPLLPPSLPSFVPPSLVPLSLDPSLPPSLPPSFLSPSIPPTLPPPFHHSLSLPSTSSCVSSAKQPTPIKVSLPNGEQMDGQAWRTTPYSIAAQISKGLADNAVIAKVCVGVWKSNVCLST